MITLSKSTFIRTPSPAHLDALDGFRGLLALWVYLGHLSYAVGYQSYLLGMHALAVDLFMVLSGFLMVHTWKGELKFGTDWLQTIKRFYLARFFRIAPLYYFLLLVSYIFLPELVTATNEIQRMMPPPWAQGLENFTPNADWNFNNWRWFYLHLTFLFGLVPGMESSSPLPDWSLSLEMQFYILFPLLLIALTRVHIILVAIAVAALAFVSPALFGNYLTPGSLLHFGQPSLLCYRLSAFVAGMLVACRLRGQHQPHSRFIAIRWLIACVIAIAPLSKPVIVIYCLFVVLVLRPIPLLSNALSSRPLRFLGNISYSIYLSHLLVVLPLTYWLFMRAGFLELAPISRFALAIGLTAPIVITISFILSLYIERPSIKLVKVLLPVKN